MSKSLRSPVFQIRRGGIKGNLVRYPDDVFDKLVGTSEHGPYKIAYRPSMLKFTGGPTQIELVNHSNAPGAAHINIQLILLLSTLGVRQEVSSWCHQSKPRDLLKLYVGFPTTARQAAQCDQRHLDEQRAGDEMHQPNDIRNFKR